VGKGCAIGGKSRRERFMKAFEFQSQLSADHTLVVPPGVVEQLQGQDTLRVVLLVPDADEDKSWADLTAQQFLDGYADSDSIYDHLSTG
jgi:hypothetical protein